MSDRDPALGLLEFSSIAVGISAGDAMVKASPVGSMRAGTTHPGKYLVMVTGDTASVEVALDAARADAQAELFLPAVDPLVPEAMAGGHRAALSGEALGVVETSTVADAVRAADAGVKAARVSLPALRLADGLGGKGYALFTGAIAEVEAAVAAGRDGAGSGLVESSIIAQLHSEMADNLASDLRFLGRGDV